MLKTPRSRTLQQSFSSLSSIAVTAVTPVFFLAATLMGSARVGLAGQTIAVNQLPKEVASAIQTRFPQAKVIAAEQELEDGQVEYYEVKLEDGNRRQEVKVAPDGKVLQVDAD
jgi:hypothetical protein